MKRPHLCEVLRWIIEIDVDQLAQYTGLPRPHTTTAQLRNLRALTVTAARMALLREINRRRLED